MTDEQQRSSMLAKYSSPFEKLIRNLRASLSSVHANYASRSDQTTTTCASQRVLEAEEKCREGKFDQATTLLDGALPEINDFVFLDAITRRLGHDKPSELLRFRILDRMTQIDPARKDVIERIAQSDRRLGKS